MTTSRPTKTKTTAKKPASKQAEVAPKATYPFPYYGEGSAAPIREKDGLVTLIVFASPLSAADAETIAAGAPPIGDPSVGPDWLFFQSADALPSKVRKWAAETKGAVVGASSAAAYSYLSSALDPWIRSVDEAHPVALFFVGSDGKRGPWHADTVARFRERVRPVIDHLRAEGAGDHADWIATSFLRSGAQTSFEDIRDLAEQDPIGAVGAIGRRCLLAWPLVEQVGPGAISALGPYAELGFWAYASVRELVPDVVAHAGHLARLADACDAKRKPHAVQQLLVFAACSTMRDQLPIEVRVERPERVPTKRPEALEAAASIGEKAASFGAIPVGLLEMLIDAARVLGGGGGAVKIALRFLRDTIAATSSERETEIASRELDCLQTIAVALEKDLMGAPDPALASILATIPAPVPVESPIAGASHPHLARLNHDRLTVRYRGSAEPQTIVVERKGSPLPGDKGENFRRMRDVVELIESGLAGADVFAPEIGEAVVLEGPTVNDDARDARWTLRVRGIAPSFWALALDILARPGDAVFGGEFRKCPAHLSIVSTLPPDGSREAATTDDVLGWLADPTPACAAFPDPPFQVNASKRAGDAIVLKPIKMTPKVEKKVKSAYYQLGSVFSALPNRNKTRDLGSVEAGKTQVKIVYRNKPLPKALAHGPLLNVARWVHFGGSPLASVEI